MTTKFPEKVYIATVTPEQAQAWLDAAPANFRKVRRANVLRYKAEMDAGEFVLNGSTLTFDWHGLLGDGQHRLLALIEHGRPQRFIIFEGCDPAAMISVDTGRVRTAPQFLSAAGWRNPTRVAGVCGLLYRWREGRILATRQYTNDTLAPRTKDILDLANQDSLGISNAVQVAIDHQPLPVDPVAFVYRLMVAYDPKVADDFMAELKPGATLLPDSPASSLRRRLNKIASGVARPQGRYFLAICIKAANAFIEDRPLRVISWKGLGVSAEPFPVPNFIDWDWYLSSCETEDGL